MPRKSLILLALLGIAVPCSQAEDLMTPSRLSLTLEGEPLSDALKAFKETTGVTVVVESRLQSLDDLLARPVQIEIRNRPFWEAIQAICEEVDLDLDRVTHDQVVLKPRSLVEATLKAAMGQRQAAKPTTSGAFWVVPIYEPSEPLKIVVRPEARAVAAQVLNFGIRMVFSDGTELEYRPKHVSRIYKLSGEFVLNLDTKTFRSSQKIRQLDLEVELEVPSNWEATTLPSILSMAPREIAVAGGTIRIERAEVEDERRRFPAEFGLDVSTTGDVVAAEGGLDRFSLVDPNGLRIRPKKVAMSTGESDGLRWQWFDIGFSPSELVGELESYRLAVRLENGDEQMMGPIGDIQPRLVSAGVAKAGVNRVDLEHGKTNICFYGFQLPFRHARLDVGQDIALEASGWGQSGTESPYFNSLEFPVGEARTDPATWRLVLDVPTRSARHTLRATLNNVHVGN